VRVIKKRPIAILTLLRATLSQPFKGGCRLRNFMGQDTRGLIKSKQVSSLCLVSLEGAKIRIDERSLKRFLPRNLGESRQVGTGASLRFIKKPFRPSEKGFLQQPVEIRTLMLQQGLQQGLLDSQLLSCYVFLQTRELCHRT